jgi:hypothetical protein
MPQQQQQQHCCLTNHLDPHLWFSPFTDPINATSFEFFKKISGTTLPPYARHLLQFPAGLGGLGGRSPTLATTGSLFVIPH